MQHDDSVPFTRFVIVEPPFLRLYEPAGRFRRDIRCGHSYLFLPSGVMESAVFLLSKRHRYALSTSSNATLSANRVDAISDRIIPAAMTQAEAAKPPVARVSQVAANGTRPPRIAPAFEAIPTPVPRIRFG